MFKKKNNSSTITSIGSNLKSKNINTYDLDKKERSINTIENSFSTRDLKNDDNFGISNKINNRKNSKTGNHAAFRVYPNNIFLNTLKNEYYSGIRINKAPTFYSNKMAINKIIRKKRLEKIQMTMKTILKKLKKIIKILIKIRKQNQKQINQ